MPESVIGMANRPVGPVQFYKFLGVATHIGMGGGASPMIFFAELVLIKPRVVGEIEDGEGVLHVRQVRDGLPPCKPFLKLRAFTSGAAFPLSLDPARRYMTRLPPMTPRMIQTLLCVAIVAAGCHRVPQADADAAMETVRRNVRFLQEEKIEEMMATIHPQSPVFAATRTSVTDLVKEFDLKCELTSLEVLGEKKGDVRVRFEQITERKKGGMIEPKTRMIGVHVLRKDGEAWKIFDTEVINVELIDPLPEDPEPPEGKPAP